jgi:hypothetical protein
MKSAASWADKVDRILDSMNRECEQLDSEIQEINNISPAEAQKLLEKAKAVSHRLRVFERRTRDHVGLVMTNPMRRQRPHHIGRR